MVSCTENGKNFLMEGQKCVHHGMEGDAALWLKCSRTQSSCSIPSLCFTAKARQDTQSCLMAHCCAQPRLPDSFKATWVSLGGPKVQIAAKAPQFVEVKSYFYPKSLFLWWAMNTCSASELLQSSLMSAGFGSHLCT